MIFPALGGSEGTIQRWQTEIGDVIRAFFCGNMSLYLGRINDWLQLKVYKAALCVLKCY